jgi:dihydrofolate reductase
MRQIILNLAVSLDGFIEGSGGEYDWCFADQDYGMAEFLTRIDTLFLGRKSYNMMRQQESNFFSDKSWYVFSKTLTSTPDQVQLINNDFAQTVLTIKNQSGKDIWLFGGANLTTSFLNAGLIDELLLSVHPILLGSGKPLFQHLTERMSFDLVDTKSYSSGLVQLQYRKPSID